MSAHISKTDEINGNEVKRVLGNVHPQMLKAGSPRDPQKLVDEASREIGQAFEWAIDQVHTNKGAVSTELGYTNQSVIGRWISGKERVQLDKLRALSRNVYREFLLALLQMEEGVEILVQVNMRRVG
jgi:hypothetical protein